MCHSPAERITSRTVVRMLSLTGGPSVRCCSRRTLSSHFIN